MDTAGSQSSVRLTFEAVINPEAEYSLKASEKLLVTCSWNPTDDPNRYGWLSKASNKWRFSFDAPVSEGLVRYLHSTPVTFMLWRLPKPSITSGGMSPSKSLGMSVGGGGAPQYITDTTSAGRRPGTGHSRMSRSPFSGDPSTMMATAAAADSTDIDYAALLQPAVARPKSRSAAEDSGGLQLLNPKTPPLPHHFDAPERHILEFMASLAAGQGNTATSVTLDVSFPSSLTATTKDPSPPVIATDTSVAIPEIGGDNDNDAAINSSEVADPTLPSNSTTTAPATSPPTPPPVKPRTDTVSSSQPPGRYKDAVLVGKLSLNGRLLFWDQLSVSARFGS